MDQEDRKPAAPEYGYENGEYSYEKKICEGIMAALLVISLAGCGSSGSGSLPRDIGSVEGDQTQILYSNFTDVDSQNEIVGILQEHGVDQEQTSTLLAWADDFNSRVTKPPLPEGFVEMNGDYVDYSGLLFDYKELPDGTFFSEANCRLTAYLLMKDLIQTNGAAEEGDTYLMFDIEAIDTQEEYQLSREKREDFITLYNNVSIEGTNTLDEHVEKIKEAWTARKIEIDRTSGISLIEVYLHSTFDDVRFVGHTGVLVENENGLLFVEKYGPEAPFQATRFHNRSELKKYLLARPDLYGEETELPPIVMENGEVLDQEI